MFMGVCSISYTSLLFRYSSFNSVTSYGEVIKSNTFDRKLSSSNIFFLNIFISKFSCAASLPFGYTKRQRRGSVGSMPRTIVT